jgi:phosphoglycerate dehydrogenase-like enzyme
VSATVLVTFAPPDPEVRAALLEPLGGLAEVAVLPELEDGRRARALATADALVCWHPASELSGPGELDGLGSARLLQMLSAGVDHVPFDRLPAGLPVAANAGAYAEPIAEHALAMALALAKQLPQNHAGMARGEFNQESLTRRIRGATVAVLGFGGIGRASAELFRALGARIHAVTRSGGSDPLADASSTLDELGDVLAAADVVLVSLPLTRTTRGLIGARELGRMREDAVLVNVARAAIIDEDALYAHLAEHPRFGAGIDTWWEEPRSGAPFRARRPFFELPNVLGSPHNSGMTEGTLPAAAGQAAENVARVLRGEPPEHVIDPSEYR